MAVVIAARHIDETFGIPDLVGGLFIIGFLCALPESFAAWRLSRDGGATTAVSGTVADGIVSLTLALVPPALIGAAVGNVALYAMNLGFIAFVSGGGGMKKPRAGRGQVMQTKSLRDNSARMSARIAGPVAGAGGI